MLYFTQLIEMSKSLNFIISVKYFRFKQLLSKAISIFPSISIDDQTGLLFSSNSLNSASFWYKGKNAQML